MVRSWNSSCGVTRSSLPISSGNDHLYCTAILLLCISHAIFFYYSTGSMIALDRPYIASSAESALDTAEELCLEYGSATQLYLVPFIQHEEQVRLYFLTKWFYFLQYHKIKYFLYQVSVALSQNRNQGSRLLSMLDHSQAPIISQVTLPCDSQGSVDFTSYPFQVSSSSVQHVFSLPTYQLSCFFLPWWSRKGLTATI